MADIDRGWLAGLLEGEGSFAAYRTHGPRRRRRVVVTQVNREPLTRALRITGVGHINGPYRDNRGNRQGLYHWKVARHEDVDDLVEAVKDQLSIKKREDIFHMYEADHV